MIRVFKHYFPYNVVLLCLVDLLLLAAAGEAAWRLRVSQIGSSNGPLWDRLPELGGFALVVWLAIIAVGGYSPEALRSSKRGQIRVPSSAPIRVS